MAQLMQFFDATQIQPDYGFSPLPVGIYDVRITDSEVKQNAAGTGGYLRLKFECVDGINAGGTGFMLINLYSQSEKAKEIAQRQLSAICHSTGILMLQDSVQLHGQVIRVDVRLQADGYGGEKGYTEVKNIIMRNDEHKQQAPAQAPTMAQAHAAWEQAPAQAPTMAQAPAAWGQAPAAGGQAAGGLAAGGQAAWGQDPAAGGLAQQPASNNDIPY